MNFNNAGQDLLNSILSNPNTLRVPVTGGKFKGGSHYIGPDGIGVTYDSDNVFQYFGEFGQ